MSQKFIVLSTVSIIILLIVLFIFIGSGFDFDYLIPKRVTRVITIILASICLAVSSIIFQTIVGNRILVPSVMGYEAVYLLWQALLLFFLGTQGQALLSSVSNFSISMVLMLGYSWAIHAWLIPRYKQDIIQLLLFGLVLTMVISTFTQYIQLSISPGEFSIFQGFSYTSFNRTKPDELFYGSMVVLAILCVAYKTLPVLDVMALGREQSISLGVDYHRYVKFFIALIAILVAVSTSLIGPTAFMGIFVANITYALAIRHQHKILLPLGCAISIIIFLIAQFFVEHVFNYRTSVNILVNLFCGTYFILFIIRSRGK